MNEFETLLAACKWARNESEKAQDRWQRRKTNKNRTALNHWIAKLMFERKQLDEMIRKTDG